MNSFQLTPDAKASMISIALYTQKRWGKQQRIIYMKMVDQCFHDLVANPLQGKARPEIYHTMRSRPVGKHIVFYIPLDQQIIIVNVIHERMDPARHLHNLPA